MNKQLQALSAGMKTLGERIGTGVTTMVSAFQALGVSAAEAFMSMSQQLAAITEGPELDAVSIHHGTVSAVYVGMSGPVSYGGMWQAPTVTGMWQAPTVTGPAPCPKCRRENSWRTIEQQGEVFTLLRCACGWETTDHTVIAAVKHGDDRYRACYLCNRPALKADVITRIEHEVIDVTTFGSPQTFIQGQSDVRFYCTTCVPHGVPVPAAPEPEPEPLPEPKAIGKRRIKVR